MTRRQTILVVIWLVIAVHFLKDVTQDILKIPTFLDKLGDLKEDLSSFPKYIQSAFHYLAISSFIAEAFLLVAIPPTIKKKAVTKLEKSIYVVATLLLLYFGTIALLSPNSLRF